MAKFNVVGLEDLLEDLNKEPIRVEQLAPEMLAAGAKVIGDAQKEEARAMIASGKIRFLGNDSRSTGDFVESIKPTRVRRQGKKAFVDVYPQGTDQKGIRNAEKGFIAEYGTKKMPAYPWMSVANEKAHDEAVAKMQEIWNKER